MWNKMFLKILHLPLRSRSTPRVGRRPTGWISSVVFVLFYGQTNKQTIKKGSGEIITSLAELMSHIIFPFDLAVNANCTLSHWRHKPDVSGCWWVFCSLWNRFKCNTHSHLEVIQSDNQPFDIHHCRCYYRLKTNIMSTASIFFFFSLTRSFFNQSPLSCLTFRLSRSLFEMLTDVLLLVMKALIRKVSMERSARVMIYNKKSNIENHSVSLCCFLLYSSPSLKLSLKTDVRNLRREDSDWPGEMNIKRMK